jgi:hypothetical protein
MEKPKSQKEIPAGRLTSPGLPHRDERAEEKRAPTGEGQALPIKQTLTRKEIRAQYGWSERSTARLEKRGLLVASKLFRKRLYLRTDVEACVRESK